MHECDHVRTACLYRVAIFTWENEQIEQHTLCHMHEHHEDTRERELQSIDNFQYPMPIEMFVSLVVF